jgi:hypothetical protein
MIGLAHCPSCRRDRLDVLGQCLTCANVASHRIAQVLGGRCEEWEWGWMFVGAGRALPEKRVPCEPLPYTYGEPTWPGPW